MKLWIVFGCLLNSTLLDFFLFEPNFQSSFSSLNNVPTLEFYRVLDGRERERKRERERERERKKLFNKSKINE